MYFRDVQVFPAGVLDAANPVLRDKVLYVDQGSGAIKVGDGVSNWSAGTSLVGSGGGSSGAAGYIQTGDGAGAFVGDPGFWFTLTSGSYPQVQIGKADNSSVNPGLTIIGQGAYVNVSDTASGKSTYLDGNGFNVSYTGGGFGDPAGNYNGTVVWIIDSDGKVQIGDPRSYWTGSYLEIDVLGGTCKSNLTHYMDRDEIWKFSGDGPVVKDTSNGHWYRLKTTGGVIGLDDLGTSLP